MRKTILLLTLILFSLVGFSQIKVYRVDNYIYVVDSVAGQTADNGLTRGAIGEVKITWNSEDSDRFYFINLRSDQYTAGGVLFSDIYRKDGTPYPSIEEFKLWADQNTSFKQGAGGGGMESSIYDPQGIEDDAFNIDNIVEGENKILTQSERNIIQFTENAVLVQGITGVLEGGYIMINTDPTKYDIEDGRGIIIDAFTDPKNTTFDTLSWAGFAGLSPTLAFNQVIYVAIENDGFGNAQILEQNTPFENEQRRDLLEIGRYFVNASGTILTDAQDISMARGVGYLALDMATALGVINRRGNEFIAANNTDLSIKKTEGQSFKKSVNYVNNIKCPNCKVSPVNPSITFLYAYNDGTGKATIVPGQTQIDPTMYDDGDGILASVGVNEWTNIPVWFNPENEAVLMQYGQAIYSTLDSAIASRADFASLDPTLGLDLIRTIITVRGGADSLVLETDVSFFQTTKFGLLTGTGGSSNGGGGVGAKRFSELEDTPNYAGNDGNKLIIDEPGLKLIAVKDNNHTTQYTSTNITITDPFTFVDATTGITTIALPPSPETGDFYTIKKKDSSVNEVIMDGNSNTIDGFSTLNLQFQQDIIEVIYDGLEWSIIN